VRTSLSTYLPLYLFAYLPVYLSTKWYTKLCGPCRDASKRCQWLFATSGGAIRQAKTEL